jgi:hypothetical protein
MPHRHVHETLAETTPDRLYAAIADIRRWPEWDDDLASTHHDGSPLRPGSRFALTPKGGRRVAMRIEALEPPHLFVDAADLPLGCIRHAHEFIAAPGGRTLIRHTIEVSGPLALLWDRLIARKLAAGLDEQAPRLVAFARSL